MQRRDLLSEVDRRTVRVNIFKMVVDPQHMYSNESEWADENLYDDFKLKKHTLVSMV